MSRLNWLLGAAFALLPSALHAQDALEAFRNSPYDYCDAKKVGAVWERSAWDAKAVIGDKILNGRTGLVDRDIAGATHIRCSTDDFGLSFADAERLATFWGTSVDRAKTKAADIASQRGGAGFRREMARVGFRL